MNTVGPRQGLGGELTYREQCQLSTGKSQTSLGGGKWDNMAPRPSKTTKGKHAAEKRMRRRKNV